MTSSPVAAVTGANGLVGSLACQGLADAGFAIRRLVRRPDATRGDRQFDLVGGAAEADLADVDVLVHCAYDLKVTARRDIWRVNVFGTRRLFDTAVRAGVRRTIFISSMSAFAGTRQLYGGAKLASESDAFRRDMSVVRLGLVYGPRWGGMAGSLRRAASAPVVPVVGRNSHQFTVHEDDLTGAFGVLAHADQVPRQPLGLAHPQPVSFGDLIAGFAPRQDRPPRLVPMPWRPMYVAMRMAELMKVSLPVRADSMLGLVRQAPTVPAVEVVRSLGITLRPFAPPSA